MAKPVEKKSDPYAMPDFLVDVLRGQDAADREKAAREGKKAPPSFAELAEGMGGAKKAHLKLQAHQSGKAHGKEKPNNGYFPVEQRVKAWNRKLPEYKAKGPMIGAESATQLAKLHGGRGKGKPSGMAHAAPKKAPVNKPEVTYAQVSKPPEHKKPEDLVQFARGLEYFKKPGPNDKYNDWFTDGAKLKPPSTKPI